MTTITGVRAATDPFGVIRAVSKAAISITVTIRRLGLVPPSRIANPPAAAVTPLASKASLTTNKAAMNSTVGSPKPATASPKSSTPVAHRASGTSSAMTAMGSRSQMNSRTAAARMIRAMVLSGMATLSEETARRLR